MDGRRRSLLLAAGAMGSLLQHSRAAPEPAVRLPNRRSSGADLARMASQQQQQYY
jgi:hypothetical protein